MTRSYYKSINNQFILLVAILITGCSKPASPVPAPSQIIANGGVVIGYDVLVELPSGESVGITEGSSFQKEGKAFEWKGGTIQVNGESFGEIAKGDNVKIEQSGRVLVNGKPRDPVTNSK